MDFNGPNPEHPGPMPPGCKRLLLFAMVTVVTIDVFIYLALYLKQP